MSGNHCRTIRMLSWGIILGAGLENGNPPAGNQSRKAKVQSSGVYLYQHADYQGRHISMRRSTLIRTLWNKG